ncbi:hypothetical protein Hanom_Chr08g00720651 [Helianthus anomalus]
MNTLFPTNSFPLSSFSLLLTISSSSFTLSLHLLPPPPTSRLPPPTFHHHLHLIPPTYDFMTLFRHLFQPPPPSTTTLSIFLHHTAPTITTNRHRPHHSTQISQQLVATNRI